MRRWGMKAGRDVCASVRQRTVKSFLTITLPSTSFGVGKSVSYKRFSAGPFSRMTTACSGTTRKRRAKRL